ncbi:MAG: hypothetical protein QOH05_4583 [Acetobacteraceae bacterium]|jgi:hypothetical protein|nr:hypothetical protein [Acetobacteraceae bacterium]
MSHYRIYELNADGQFAGPSCDMQCGDDSEALKIAHGMMPDTVPEIWQGTRRVAYDPTLLTERAELWRAEAAAATFEEMREFCRAEADRCERRLQVFHSAGSKAR